jgi:hypothetical protein
VLGWWGSAKGYDRSQLAESCARRMEGSPTKSVTKSNSTDVDYQNN